MAGMNSDGSRAWLIAGLFLLLTELHTHLLVIADPSDTSCSASGTCQGSLPDANEFSIKDRCVEDAERGLCYTDPKGMLERCSPYDYCTSLSDFGAIVLLSVDSDEKDGKCADVDEDCQVMAADDHDCLLNPDFMIENCPRSCFACYDHGIKEGPLRLPIGVKQILPSMHTSKEKRLWYALVAETAKYMAENVYVLDKYKQARRDCRNTDPLCIWKVASTKGGYCDEAESTRKCGPACQACQQMILTEDELELLYDCTPDEEMNAFDPENDSKTINAMFRRIIGELPYQSSPGEAYPIVPGVNYTAKVLSRPSLEPDTNLPLGAIDYHVGGPWIVVLEDFLTTEECNRLIELGDIIGRIRSTIEEEIDDDEYENDEDGERLDQVKEDEEKPWRTSSTAWCEDKICAEDPVVKRVQQRIGLTTGVTDDDYYEMLQLLKYRTYPA
jgi:prolyl 4-hydroxylase